MSLEKDIQQPKFRNEYQKGIINLIYTYFWVSDCTRNIFKQFDVTQQQYNILRILRGSHPQPCTINFLKERMLDKMSDTSRLVDRLIKKELVEKCQFKKDKRVSNITISPKGLELLEKADKHVIKIDEIFSNLDEEEIKQLNALLDKARNKEKK